MALEDALRQADFHRNNMRRLSMSENVDVSQAALAILDIMLWLDSNFTYLHTLFSKVSTLESDLESANDRIQALEIQIRRQ